MARGGSKGFPGKNLKPLGGQPLIVWTIDAAKNAKYLDRVIVSTDDAKIATVCEQHGCTAPFMRPSHLAEDHSTAVDVAIHALDTLDENFDYLVLLQATSPHRNGEDINGCLELCASHQAPGCVSVTRVDKPPEWMFHLDADSRLQIQHGLEQKLRVASESMQRPTTDAFSATLFCSSHSSRLGHPFPCRKNIRPQVLNQASLDRFHAKELVKFNDSTA